MQVGIGAPRAEHAFPPHTWARDLRSGRAPGVRLRTSVDAQATPPIPRPHGRRLNGRDEGGEPEAPTRGRRAAPRGHRRAHDSGTPGGLDPGTWGHAPPTAAACPRPGPASPWMRPRPVTGHAAATMPRRAGMQTGVRRNWCPPQLVPAGSVNCRRPRPPPRGRRTAASPIPSAGERSRIAATIVEAPARPHRRESAPYPRKAPARPGVCAGCPSPDGQASLRPPGSDGCAPSRRRPATSGCLLRRRRRLLAVQPRRCGPARRPPRCRGRRHPRRAGRGPRPPAH